MQIFKVRFPARECKGTCVCVSAETECECIQSVHAISITNTISCSTASQLSGKGCEFSSLLVTFYTAREKRSSSEPQKASEKRCIFAGGIASTRYPHSRVTMYKAFRNSLTVALKLCVFGFAESYPRYQEIETFYFFHRSR
eukprot:4502-Rhodomonas_salina.2